MTFYRWLVRLLLPLALLRLVWRGFKNRNYWRRWGERFGFVASFGTAPIIWLHAVSVGETRAAEPLVKALQQRYPDHRILVTTTTPTGSDQVRRSFGDRVAHSYFPYDVPSIVARFLRCVRPRILIVMETEWWPVLFHSARAHGIPIMVANLRLSARAAARYARFAELTRATLMQVNAFAVQAQADAERLQALGAPAVRIGVTGSIKYEIDIPERLRIAARALRAHWGDARPVWIAASTHAGEDEQVLQAHRALRARFPSLLLVLVPRHPERFEAAVQRCRTEGFRIARRSANTAAIDDANVVVGDTMGELQLLIAASDVAFIGGSLVAVGGHNLLEAAAAGVPAIFGPHMFNFAEIAAVAVQRGAAQQVADATQLITAVAELFALPERRTAMSRAGENLIAENRGALAQTLALLTTIYPPSS